MTTRSWIRRLFARSPRTRRTAPARFRPRLEALEDRLAPALSVSANGLAAASGTIPQPQDRPIGAVSLPASLQVTAPANDYLTKAVVTLNGRRDGNDEFLTVGVFGTNLSAAYDTSTGTLTLTGTDTAADYQQALQSIKFDDLSPDPSPVPRQVTVQVSDGVTWSDKATITLNIIPNNSDPIVDLDGTDGGDTTAAFTPGQGPVTLAPALTLADPESATLALATVSILNLQDVGNEVLTANTTGTSISASYNAQTGVLSLFGSDSLANYQQVLRTVAYNDLANVPGPLDRAVAFTLNDGISTSPTSEVAVSVPPPPNFTASDPPAVNEDSGAHTVSPWATFVPPAGETNPSPSYAVSNVSNTTLFSVGPAVDANGNLTYTLAANVSGSSTFDVQVQDNGNTSATKTFTLTVNLVNDQPSFTASNQTANADSGAHTVSGWATFNPGSGANEAGQKVLADTVSNVSNPGLFAVLPAVDTGGNLTYTLNPNVSGSSTFDVKVQDNGGTANGGVDTSVAQTFTLTVNRVNTTTAVTSSVNPSVFGRSVTFTATVSAQAPGAGTPTGTVTFLDGGSPVGTGTLSGGVATFTTSALAEGDHTVTASYGGDGNFKGGTGALTGNPQVVNQPPSVSMAFSPFGEVMELVSSTGTLTQFDATGAHVLGGGVRAASVAFGPGGEELLITFQTGALTLFDAAGIHPLGNSGVLSASIAFGPQGAVAEVVALDGTLRQYDASGVRLLGGGVRSTSVAFTPGGAEELLVTFQNGALTLFDAAGAHPLGSGGVLSAGLSFDATGAAVVDVLTLDGTLTQYDSAGIHALGRVF